MSRIQYTPNPPLQSLTEQSSKDLASYLQGELDQIANFIGEVSEGVDTCVVNTSSNISIPTGTPTAVVFNSTVSDPYNAHSTSVNNTRIVVPVGNTKARLTGSITWGASASTGILVLNSKKNGAAFNGSGVSVANNTGNAFFSTVSSISSPWVDVVAGDYFELGVIQGTGGSLNILTSESTWFSVEFA
jgi:hypothetical protein